MLIGAPDLAHRMAEEESSLTPHQSGRFSVSFGNILYWRDPHIENIQSDPDRHLVKIRFTLPVPLEQCLKDTPRLQIMRFTICDHLRHKVVIGQWHIRKTTKIYALPGAEDYHRLLMEAEVIDAEPIDGIVFHSGEIFRETAALEGLR